MTAEHHTQRDYYREQEWKSGELTYDSLGSFEGNSVGCMPSNWKNPYPNNYEPVKQEGCYMFHCNGYHFNAYLYENMVEAKMNCYIYDDLDEGIKPEMNLITKAHVVTSRGMLIFSKTAQNRSRKSSRRIRSTPSRYGRRS